MAGNRDAVRAAARNLAFLARVLEGAAGDLTLAQYRVLALVASGDERASLLANRLAVRKPTISAVVDGLVERGHLAREAVAGDRRQVRLVLTPKGGAALDAAETAMAERLATLARDVGDRRALYAGLAELTAAYEAQVRARIGASREGAGA